MINTNYNNRKNNLNIVKQKNEKFLNKIFDTLNQKDNFINSHKDIKSILNIFLNNQNKNQSILELLKNNPTFRTLSDITTTLDNLLNDKNISTNLKKNIQQLNVDIKDISAKNLKINIQNSGIFLENKLKNNQNIKDDLKASILKEKEVLISSTTKNKTTLQNIDKLNLQLDYYQLISSLSSPTIFLPYKWEKLQDGNLSFKELKDNSYICDIELNLKNYDTINLRLKIFEKNNLTITINTISKELKSLIKNNLQELRKNLTDVKLSPKNINFIDNKKNNLYNDDVDIELGFKITV